MALSLAGPLAVSFRPVVSIAERQWRPPHGFAQFLRPFSVHSGWLAKPIVVSRKDGNRTVWPGDTIGISILDRPGRKLMLSWGSAVSHLIPEIWAAAVTL